MAFWTGSTGTSLWPVAPHTQVSAMCGQIWKAPDRSASSSALKPDTRDPFDITRKQSALSLGFSSKKRIPQQRVYFGCKVCTYLILTCVCTPSGQHPALCQGRTPELVRQTEHLTASLAYLRCSILYIVIFTLQYEVSFGALSHRFQVQRVYSCIHTAGDPVTSVKDLCTRLIRSWRAYTLCPTCYICGTCHQ